MNDSSPDRTDSNERIIRALLAGPATVWLPCIQMARQVELNPWSLSRSLMRWEKWRWVDTQMVVGFGKRYRMTRLTPQGRILAEVWLEARANAVWERCTGCWGEYAYPHLCREHMLCAICHPDTGETT